MRKPGSDEVRYYINTKEIINLWSEDKIELGYSRRKWSELEAHKWWYVESIKGGFVLKTSRVITTLSINIYSYHFQKY